MSANLIARRYADGLSATIEQDGELQPTLDALREFVALYDQNAQLRVVLENPAIEATRRTALLEEILRRLGTPKFPACYIRALFKRRRISVIAASVEAFAHLCDLRLGRESAEMITAVKLSDEAAERVRSAIAVFADKSIEATQRVDPSIVGGIIVRVGGFVIDGSLRRELTRVKQELVERE